MIKVLLFIVFILLAVFNDIIFKDNFFAKIIIAIFGLIISLSFLYP